MRLLAFTVVGALASGSLAVAQEPLNDLTNRQMVVLDEQGAKTTMQFDAGGIVRVTSPTGDETGRWKIADDHLCFEFNGEEPDCWPWDGRLPEGRAIPAAHSDGRALIIMLQPRMQPGSSEDD